MKEASLVTKRDASFDILKGILILLVVLGHAISDTYTNELWQRVLFNLIYSFHMPLFVMISGYFSHSMDKRDIREVIANKAKRLMLPWFIWSTIMAFFFFVSKESFDNPIQGAGLYKELYRIYTEIWYLICVFVLTLFWYPFTRLKSEASNNKWIMICFGLFFVWLMFLFFDERVPNWMLKRCQIVRQTLVFGLGLLCYYKASNLKRYTKNGLLVVSITVIIVDKLILGGELRNYNLYQRIIDGLACTILAFAILKSLSSYLQQKRICPILLYLGRNSLGFYVVHMVIRTFLTRNHLIPSASSYISGGLVLILLLCGSIIVVESFKRIFLSKSYIFGI